jgi:hypothetical protein
LKSDEDAKKCNFQDITFTKNTAFKKSWEGENEVLKRRKSGFGGTEKCDFQDITFMKNTAFKGSWEGENEVLKRRKLGFGGTGGA